MSETGEGAKANITTRVVEKVKSDFRDVAGVFRRNEAKQPVTMEDQLKIAGKPTAQINEDRPTIDNQVKEKKLENARAALGAIEKATDELKDHTEFDTVIMEELLREKGPEAVEKYKKSVGIT